jgi:hypothetical protein
MERNPNEEGVFSLREVTTETVAWDADSEAFVRITMSACGRILARADLDPPERRAALRCLMATRTTLQQRRAMGRLLRRFGLVAGSPGALRPVEHAAVVDLLSARFLAGLCSDDIAAFVEHMETGLHEFLVLAWCVAMVQAAPDQPLPRLEDIDANLPYMPPHGLEPAPKAFDAIGFLAEVDADEPEGEASSKWPLARPR